MSLTPEDIAAALTKAAGYDSAHTPRASAVLTGAWMEHFDTYAPSATRDDLLAAVTEYHREPHDRMLQPADLTCLIRAWRRDEYARTDPAVRALPAASLSPGEVADYPDEWTPEERLAAYWHMVRTRSMPKTTANWQALMRTIRPHQKADQ